MQDNKSTIAHNIKRRQFGYVNPFQCYNQNVNKQRNTSYMASSHRKTNRSVLEYDDGQRLRGQLCLKHSQGLNWVCFTCGFGVYCSQCMIETHKNVGNTKSRQELTRSQQPKSGIQTLNPSLSFSSHPSHPTQPFSSPCPTPHPHLQHDIRSVQQSFLFMRNSLIQCQIRLQAKCNILTNMNQQIHNHKIQLFNQKNDYKQQLQRQFDYIYQVLRQKQQQMYSQIEQIFVENQRTYVSMIQEIKSLQQYYDQCQHSIAGVLQQQQYNNSQQQQSMGNNNNNNNSNLLPSPQHNTQLHTCLFYSQHANALTQLLSDQQIDSIKNGIYILNYKLESHNLNTILNYINQLEITSQQKFVYRNVNQKQQQQQHSLHNSLQKSLTKVKSQTLLIDKGKQQKKHNKKPIAYLHLQQVEKNPTQKSKHSLLRNQKQRQSHKVLPTFATSTPKALSKQNKLQFLKKSPQNTLLKKRKKSNAKMVSMPASPAKQDKQERTFSPINKARDFIIEGMKKKTTIVKKKK